MHNPTNTPAQLLPRCLMLAALFAATGLMAGLGARPNIVFVLTDDQGFADLGANGARDDVRTPHLDRLAADGVRFTKAYSTAPQCIPARAGIVAGRHQNAFGLDDNLKGPLDRGEFTVAERLREAGYRTGMVGKWHLEIGFDERNQVYFSRAHLPDMHGFDDMFMGYLQDYHANYDLEGNDLPGGYQMIQDPHYRIDIQTRAALTFLDRWQADAEEAPFFLFLCYFGPHSPIESPPQYMERLGHVEGDIRRQALASVLAIDDGFGLIRDKIESMGADEDTLYFFMSDNGAPLRENAYVGSLNDPHIGEKGMLTDGGQRVPTIATWPGTLPAGMVFDEPVSAIDLSATQIAAAGAPMDRRVEGVNLLPYLTGETTEPLDRPLFWRWRSQSAIRQGDWKFVRLGNERTYLFDLSEPGKETAGENLIATHPEKAAALEARLRKEANTWAERGLPDAVVGPDRLFFDLHVDPNLPPPPLDAGTPGQLLPWEASRPQTAPDAPYADWKAASAAYEAKP